LVNKLKKLEGILQVRDDKVAELEKIIQSSVGGESSDLLEHSLYLGPDQQDFHTLQ
jgi:predicted  nucleic acid-binding Zn-ribbon protein